MTDAIAKVAELVERSRSRKGREVADMEARGVIPGEVPAVFSPYCEGLSWGLKWLDGDPGTVMAMISSSMHDHRKPRGGHALRAVWGRRWPGHGVNLSAGDLLSFMASSWTVLVADFLPVPARVDAVIDFRAGISRPDLPRFEIAVSGREMEVRGPRGKCLLGSESLMVAESLLALGQELASGLEAAGLRPDAVSAWRAARALDNLPPTEAERGDLQGPGEACVREGAAYYARRLDISPGDYLSVALFEGAAHTVWHADGRPGVEPMGGDGMCALLMGTLPRRDEILAMARRAREDTADPDLADDAAWEIQSLGQLNTDTRAAVFYSGWPDRPSPLPPIRPRLDPATLVGTRIRLGCQTGIVTGVAERPSRVGEPRVTVAMDAEDPGRGRGATDWRVSDVLRRALDAPADG